MRRHTLSSADFLVLVIVSALNSDSFNVPRSTLSFLNTPYKQHPCHLDDALLCDGTMHLTPSIYLSTCTTASQTGVYPSKAFEHTSPTPPATAKWQHGIPLCPLHDHLCSHNLNSRFRTVTLDDGCMRAKVYRCGRCY